MPRPSKEQISEPALEDAPEEEGANIEEQAPALPLQIHQPAAPLWGGSMVMVGSRADKISAFLDRPKFTIVGESRRRARSVPLQGDTEERTRGDSTPITQPPKMARTETHDSLITTVLPPNTPDTASTEKQ